VKCIKCDSENNLKERKASNGRCKGCGHEFAFDPKVMSGVDFTDRFFQHMLAHLSVNDTLFFTPRQLYYSFNHRRNARKKHPLQVAGGCALFAVIGLSIAAYVTVGFSVVGFVALLAIAGFCVALLISGDLRKRLSGVRPQALDITPDKVDAWYKRWSKINGPDAKLLPSPKSQERTKLGIPPLNAELRKYSFDRAVVCDRLEIAQCLIANNFHFEHNCAVLSVDGYPHDIFATVMDMLRSNPSLSVYALHDASAQGVELTHILRTRPEWFGGSTATVYDLGLLPRQIFNRSVFIEKTGGFVRASPDYAASTLEAEELRWLETGNYVALESFPPKMLLRVVAQGISKSRDPQAPDALVPVMIEGDSGGFYYYAFDSFG
jgi:hypothetical protein